MKNKKGTIEIISHTSYMDSCPWEGYPEEGCYTDGNCTGCVYAAKKKERSEILCSPNFIAVLSTTVLPLDGVYKVETLPAGEVPDITGVPHYIGHPDTKVLVESFGAIQAKSKLFPGLQPGEQSVCFPIQQGKSTRTTEGFTNPHQAVSMSDLSIRIIVRIE